MTILSVSGCGNRNNSGEGKTSDADTAITNATETELSEENSFTSTGIPDAVAEKMKGVSYPEDPDSNAITLSDLRYLKVLYINFEDETCEGEIVCNKAIASDLLEIFRDLYHERYQIRSIRLIDDFGGSDEASMRADNSSCFNYRPATGQRKTLSQHAYGRAIDINPFENPYVKNGTVKPEEASEYADRSNAREHMITRDDLCYKLFIEHGFRWGGAWRSCQDYQHFEKK